MNAILTFVNALAAVYGSYLVCANQWIAGTALMVVPLFSVYALSLRKHAGVKRVAYIFNAVLVAIGIAYTIFALNRVAGMEPEAGGGLIGFIREIWLSLWLLVLPALTGWLLWTQENRLKRGQPDNDL